MKVLVTGAAGFLGRWFVADHLNRGDDVYGVDDLSGPFSHWPEALRVDRRYEMDVVGFFRFAQNRAFDLAYHFAAPVGGRVKIEEDPLFNAGSLGLDAAFFRWATTNTETAVYPSSSAVYPVDDQLETFHHALSESLFSPVSPGTVKAWGKPDQIYGLTKLVGEVLAWRSAAYGLKTLCIRPFSGYGEDQGLDYPVPAIAQRAAMGENPIRIWGSGAQTRDFVHVSDIVGATQARLAEGIYGSSGGYACMNIGSGVATSFYDVATKLLLLAQTTAEIKTDPEKPEGVKHRYADTEEMERYYQLKVPLLDGLSRMLEYRRSHLRSHA